MRELAEAGYVRQESDTRFYRPGFKILHLANVLKEQIDVRAASQQIMRGLAARTGETIQLIIPVGDYGVCVEKADGHEAVRLYSVVGRTVPLHCGAATKVILAFLPDKRTEQLLSRPLQRMTPNTITESKHLREEIQKIRAFGFAFSVEELTMGVAGVAAPVFDDSGAVVAGLSIAGPVARFTDARIAELSRVVMEAAMEISVRMGHRGEVSPAEGNRLRKQGE
jgi:DNA-binding IclR family transcriptional regulator